MIEDHPYYDALAASLTPELFVHRINVPVFLAGAWQDEQTGPYFANMLDNFTGTDKVWFTVTNGAHTDSLAPAVFDRWIEFLQIYVAQAVPKRPPLAAVVASVIGQEVWKTAVTLPPDRFAERDVARAGARRPSKPIRGCASCSRTAPAPHRACRTRASKAASRPGRSRARRRDRGTSARAARSSTAHRRRRQPTATPTTPRARTSRRCPATDAGTVWLPLPGLELDGTAGRQRGRVRDRAARRGHGDGRERERGSLDQDRPRPTSTSRSTITEVRPDGKEVLDAERLAARELRVRSHRRDRAAAAAHANTAAAVEDLQPSTWNAGTRRDLPVRARVPRRFEGPDHRRRAGREPARLDVRRTDRTDGHADRDRTRRRPRVARRVAGRLRRHRAGGAARVPVVARSAVPRRTARSDDAQSRAPKTAWINGAKCVSDSLP